MIFHKIFDTILTLQQGKMVGKFCFFEKNNTISEIGGNYFLENTMQKLFSASIYGISGHLVEVEVDVIPGMGQFTVVGL